MKRLLLSLLSLSLLGLSLLGMEQPPQCAVPTIPFQIDAPRYCERDNQYCFCARVKGNEVGRVWYSFIPNTHIARMHYLGVSPAYQKQKIATGLFEACIQEAKKHKRTHLVWEAMPLQAGLKLPQLIEIYKKMAHRVNPVSPLKIGQPYGPKDCQKVNITMHIGEI